MFYMTDGKPTEIEELKRTEIEDYLRLVRIWTKKIKAQTPKKKK